MNGTVGDRILVESERVGAESREGVIVEVIPGLTSVHYRVRWDDGRETVLIPGAGNVRVIGRKSA